MQDLPLKERNIKEEDLVDILELQSRIEGFKTGQEDEEKFKLYRLTRGVYGQRQFGVQMFRLKIPSGKITASQLAGVADISDAFATGNLHLTTRQNIQLHYVKLDDSPEVWARLSEIGMTAREACGNTVRNITASPAAGIDPEEAFDVTPYVDAVFNYFLRNPICQEMGRKIKPAFSSSTKDTAYTYFSDFGLTPEIRDGVRGFKFVVGGGLGALAISAQKAFDFIPTDEVIPFIEASLRVFDRYGEREKRQKARMKFLLKDLGLEKWMSLVQEELASLEKQSIPIDVEDEAIDIPEEIYPIEEGKVDEAAFAKWVLTNTFTQKQIEYRGVYIKVRLGDIHSDTARNLATVILKYAADDVRITINQNLLLRYVNPENLKALYLDLQAIHLADDGYDTIADITACPGTDTCNLGVTNSTGLAVTLEERLRAEHPSLLMEKGIDIKISGCMNACGQHMASAIGFHGSSIKHVDGIIPAMQVVVGGGIDSDGVGHMGDKVIKLPTKRIPTAVNFLLQDYEAHRNLGEEFIHYCKRQGKRYFYAVLKPLADVTGIEKEEFFDWGQEHLYNQAIGVGECAGVILDVVGTILKDADQKLEWATNSIEKEAYNDAVYHAYSAFVISAKAVLLGEDIKCNTHIKILNDFQENIIEKGLIEYSGVFSEEVLEMKKTQPSAEFATEYLAKARTFYASVLKYREQIPQSDKPVIESYYKA